MDRLALSHLCHVVKCFFRGHVGHDFVHGNECHSMVETVMFQKVWGNLLRLHYKIIQATAPNLFQCFSISVLFNLEELDDAAFDSPPIKLSTVTCARRIPELDIGPPPLTLWINFNSHLLNLFFEPFDLTWLILLLLLCHLCCALLINLRLALCTLDFLLELLDFCSNWLVLLVHPFKLLSDFVAFCWHAPVHVRIQLQFRFRLQQTFLELNFLLLLACIQRHLFTIFQILNAFLNVTLSIF